MDKNETKENNNKLINPTNTIGNYIIIIKNKDGKIIKTDICVNGTVGISNIGDNSVAFDIR